MSDYLSLSPAARCVRVLAALRQDMWTYAAWQHLLGPLLPWLSSRLNRAVRRIEALAARLAAGTLRVPAAAPRPALPHPALPRQILPCVEPATAAPPPARPPVPAGLGWLLRRVQTIDVIRLQVASSRSRLEHLLHQPDMQDLLRAAPQIGRELRPICRMLGIEVPPGLFPPSRRRPAQPRPARPKPTRAARPRSPPRTLAAYGPPSRPGWERPVRMFLPPPAPRKPPRSA